MYLPNMSEFKIHIRHSGHGFNSSRISSRQQRLAEKSASLFELPVLETSFTYLFESNLSTVTYSGFHLLYKLVFVKIESPDIAIPTGSITRLRGQKPNTYLRCLLYYKRDLKFIYVFSLKNMDMC